MRVLMINVVCGIRSTGRICTDLATALEDQGHEVKIAYGRGNVPGQFQKYAVRIGNDLDIKLHGVKARLLDGAGFGSKYVTLKFIQWIKKYNPDVIHLHNIHGYYINIEVLFDYLRVCGKKIIWTLHDCWAFTGHSATCDEINCERWKKGCFQCPKFKEYPKAYIDNSKKNWLKKKKIILSVPKMTIVTPSYWLANLSEQSFLKKFDITIIHNGIDINNFYPMESDFRKKYNLENKFVVLGVASSWGKMKGLNDFIELSKHFEDDCKIVLVGLKKEQLHKIPESIIKIERTNSTEELAQIYSMADIFLNLTYCDNYPMVNLEAISCGTPVITYDTGGSSESVPKEFGFVIEQGNLDKIIEKIYFCKKNPVYFENQKEIVHKKNIYDKTFAMNRYLRLYNVFL